MTSTILRRLFIMPVTLIGVTLLVFMLIALSPGGMSGSAAAQGSDLAASPEYEAYLEDRYGLNDPMLVQYGRWLARICPVRFGTLDQVDSAGEVVRPPREMELPALPAWFDGRSATPSATDVPPPHRDVDLVTEYRDASRAHANDRIAALRARSRLQQALAPAGEAQVHTPTAEAAAREVAAAYAAAAASRQRLVRAIAARPFPENGLPIIPGVIGLASPDLGVSLSQGRRVSALIAEALPITLLLNLAAFIVVYMTAIPGGMLAAVRRGTWIDSALGLLFIALWSVPTVWAGVLLLGFLSSSRGVAGGGWFPVGGLHDRAAEEMAFFPSVAAGGFERGFALDTLWHIVLPVICLAYTGLAVLARQTRASILENLSADYVRTARAKGAPERDVLLRHVFRNSLLPLITMFVAVFPATLSGSVIVERIFNIPGMGSLILESIYQRDREVLMANTLIIAAVNILALLLADVLYAIADPRVRKA